MYNIAPIPRQKEERKKKKERLSLHSSLRPHNPPPKKLTNNTKPIPRARQLRLKEIVLIRRLNLPLSNSPQRRIRRSTNRTLGFIVDAVETAFVEGVAAEKMDGG